MSSSTFAYPCRICGRTTSHWCSRCQNVWYCSDEHLQQDWPRHRKDCAPVTLPPNQMMTPAMPQQINASSSSSSSTTDLTVAAILLRPDDERARIISVRCQQNPGSSRSSCPIPLVQSFFPESTPSSLVLTQGLNQEPLRFPLQLWYCPVSLTRGSPANRAVHRITSGQTRKTWCGPVVVLKYSGSRRQNYGDATTHDLATLSAYFISLH